MVEKEKPQISWGVGGKRLGKEANLLQDSLVDEGKSAKLLINLPSGMPEFILEEPPKQR